MSLFTTIFDSCSRPYIVWINLASCCFCSLKRFFYLLGWWSKTFLIFFIFLWGVQARLLWNFNGRNWSSKPSYWREHMWFLVEEAAGNFICLFIFATLDAHDFWINRFMLSLFLVGNMGWGWWKWRGTGQDASSVRAGVLGCVQEKGWTCCKVKGTTTSSIVWC